MCECRLHVNGQMSEWWHCGCGSGGLRYERSAQINLVIVFVMWSVLFLFREVNDAVSGNNNGFADDLARNNEWFADELAWNNKWLADELARDNKRLAGAGTGRAVKNYRIAVPVVTLSKKFSRHVARKSPELSDSSVHLQSSVISVVRRL